MLSEQKSKKQQINRFNPTNNIINNQIQAKILIIGNEAVGKTSLLLRYVDNKFHLSYSSTIGVDFKVKRLQYKGKIIKMQIWDTAGHERFRHITQAYFRGAQGIILAYSITNRNSFESINWWSQQIQQSIGNKIPMILTGTKCDLGDARQVSQEEGQELADKLNIKFAETSAKNMINVDDVFWMLGKQIVQKKMILLNKKSKTQKKSQIKIDRESLILVESNKKNCCKL